MRLPLDWQRKMDRWRFDGIRYVQHRMADIDARLRDPKVPVRDYENMVVEQVGLMNRDDVRAAMRDLFEQVYNELNVDTSQIPWDDRAWVVPEGFGEVQAPMWWAHDDDLTTDQAYDVDLRVQDYLEHIVKDHPLRLLCDMFLGYTPGVIGCADLRDDSSNGRAVD